MRNKIISALVPTLFMASFILIIYWASCIPNDSKISGSPSGWWWFGCLLGAVFFAELED